MELYSPPHPLARLAVIIIAATLPLSAEEYIYASPHYEFICDGKLNTSVVKRFSLLFEATNQVCRELPLGMIKPLREERHKIHLFETREASTAKGGSPDSAGVCISRGGEDDILIPLTSLGVKKVGSNYSIEDMQKLIARVTAYGDNGDNGDNGEGGPRSFLRF